jgi:hypothetical protein
VAGACEYGDELSGSINASFSRRTLHYGVSK